MATKVFQYANSQILGKLSIIVDVSCDASNPHNPLPFITYNTTFSSPTKRVVDGSDGMYIFVSVMFVSLLTAPACLKAFIASTALAVLCNGFKRIDHLSA